MHEMVTSGRDPGVFIVHVDDAEGLNEEETRKLRWKDINEATVRFMQRQVYTSIFRRNPVLIEPDTVEIDGQKYPTLRGQAETVAIDHARRTGRMPAADPVPDRPDWDYLEPITKIVK